MFFRRLLLLAAGFALARWSTPVEVREHWVTECWVQKDPRSHLLGEEDWQALRRWARITVAEAYGDRVKLVALTRHSSRLVRQALLDAIAHRNVVAPEDEAIVALISEGLRDRGVYLNQPMRRTALTAARVLWDRPGVPEDLLTYVAGGASDAGDVLDLFEEMKSAGARMPQVGQWLVGNPLGLVDLLELDLVIGEERASVDFHVSQALWSPRREVMMRAALIALRDHAEGRDRARALERLRIELASPDLVALDALLRHAPPLAELEADLVARFHAYPTPALANELARLGTR